MICGGRLKRRMKLMNKQDYSFWKLLRAQWSWNNDKRGLCIFTAISLVSTTIKFFLTDITYTETGLPINYLSLDALIMWCVLYVIDITWLLVFWQVCKLLIMTVLCGGVVYEIKQELKELEYEEFLNSKWKDYYEEMLTWRQ